MVTTHAAEDYLILALKFFSLHRKQLKIGLIIIHNLFIIQWSLMNSTVQSYFIPSHVGGLLKKKRIFLAFLAFNDDVNFEP
jgi:hypothetical protein